MTGPRPPRLASALIRRLVPEPFRDAFVGDLEEGWVQRFEAEGRRAADRWFWGQVIHADVWTLRREARGLPTSVQRGGGRMFDRIGFEFRQAVRVFRRSPGFVSAVVLTLAIGIGGTTTIFSLAWGLLVNPVPGVHDVRTLAAIQASERGGSFGVGAYMDYLDLRERSRAFQNMAVFKPRIVDAAADAAPEPLGALMVTASYFEVLGVEPVAGRFFSADADIGPGAHPEVILSWPLWQRWFGSDPGVVGRDMVLNGVGFTVVGVAPRGFRGTQLVDVPELFVPISMQAEMMPGNGYLLERRGWGGVEIVGRLTEGVDVAAAHSEIAALGAQILAENPSTNGDRQYRAIEFREAAMPEGVRASMVQLSGLLAAVVAGLWLVICLNVSNLLLARSMTRRPELAVRQALGAGRSRIALQVLTEFLTISLVAGLLGVALTRLIAGVVEALPVPLAMDVRIDGITMAFAGAMAVVSGLLCAVIPAASLSRSKPAGASDPSRSTSSAGRQWVSRGLIVGQVTVSVALLFATGLFTRSFVNLNATETSFDSSNTLVARFDPGLQGYELGQIDDFYDRLTASLASIPGVSGVALTDVIPVAERPGSDGWFLEGAPDREESSRLRLNAVSHNFFETIQLPLIEGRGYTQADLSGQPTLILNEAAAQVVAERTGRAAVGQRISPNGPEGPFMEIIGVAADKRAGRSTTADPLVYAIDRHVRAVGFGGRSMVVLLKSTGPVESLAPDLRRVAATVDPNVSASELNTLQRSLDDLLIADRMIAGSLFFSSVLALLLVGAGIYGLLGYLVHQRTREFGIRRALGAGGANLGQIVAREAVALSILGLALGIASTVPIRRLVAEMLFGVTAASPAFVLAGAAAVLAATAVAAWVPVRRAMNADPIVAMRAE